MCAVQKLQPSEFAAEIIQASASALVSASVERMFAKDPSLPARWGAGAFQKWVAELHARVDQLISAARLHRPAVFVANTDWARRAYAARNVEEKDLALALECLAEVLGEELPPPAAGALHPYFQGALARFGTPLVEEHSPLDRCGEHTDLAVRYLTRLLEGKREVASRLILDAVASGVPVDRIYMQVLGPVQDELGRLWLAGDVHVGEEHYCTASTLHVMSQLYPVISAAPKRDGRTVLAASVEGNAHEIGIRMISDFFELDGWRSIYLGTSIPAEDLVQTMIDFEVDVVCLSAMLTVHLDVVGETIRVIRSEPKTTNVPVIVGGKAFMLDPDIWKDLGADGSERHPVDTVELAERLVSQGRPSN